MRGLLPTPSPAACHLQSPPPILQLRTIPARPGQASPRLLPPAFRFHYFTGPDQTSHITSFTTALSSAYAPHNNPLSLLLLTVPTISPANLWSQICWLERSWTALAGSHLIGPARLQHTAHPSLSPPNRKIQQKSQTALLLQRTPGSGWARNIHGIKEPAH